MWTTRGKTAAAIEKRKRKGTVIVLIALFLLAINAITGIITSIQHL